MDEKRRMYERYRRGQIVMVDFSPSLGSETKNKHLAIVLSKNDSPKNGVLTVIPLSSKEKPYYLSLGEILYCKVSPLLEAEINDLSYALDHLEINEETDLQAAKKNVQSLKHIVETYTKMNVNSFAMVQNITTISKLRIQKPINKYDPIKRISVDDEILSKIDAKLIKLFTK